MKTISGAFLIIIAVYHLQQVEARYHHKTTTEPSLTTPKPVGDNLSGLVKTSNAKMLEAEHPVVDSFPRVQRGIEYGFNKTSNFGFVFGQKNGSNGNGGNGSNGGNGGNTGGGQPNGGNPTTS